jgi:subtilisin family serine protease
MRAGPLPSANLTSEEQRPGCLSYLLFVGVSLWIIGVTLVIHGSAWLAGQISPYEETPPPWFAWPLISWVHGFALAVPVALLALFKRAPRLRAAYQTWMLAVLFVFVIALARVFLTTQTQPAAIAQIVLTLLSAAALWLLARVSRRDAHLGLQLSPTLIALAIAAILVVPSLSWGALGSRLDTLLDLLASLCLGLFAGILLDWFYFRPLASRPPRTRAGILFDGWIAAIALLILGSAFGSDGSQLLLMAALPGLGFGIAALAQMSRAQTVWLPIGALVGAATAGPLMFFDPDELTIILDPNPLGSEILGWALRAVLVSLALALLSGFVFLLVRPRKAPRVSVALPFFAIILLAALGMHVFFGHPGFFGEQMFVILKDQADLSQASAIADRNERTRFVYTTLTEHANRTQAHLRGMLDRGHVGYVPYYLVNALEVNGGPLLRVMLAQRSKVDRIIDSPHLRPLPAPVSVSTGDQPAPTQPPWNITSIGADRVWSELHVTGKGIVVGQSDSGVDGAHPALRDGYRGRNGHNDFNWLDPWNDTQAPTDIGGHGTHTLGSILGRNGIGVAPDAEWFACVNLARNLGNPPLYLTCMQFMLAPWPQRGDPLKDGNPAFGANVINDSWGCPPLEGCDPGSLEPAARALRTAGIFVVVSTGNEGPNCGSVRDPLAIYPSVFSVGAIDRSGNLASFSSRGPVTVDGSNRIKPDIVSPCVDVLSSFPGNTYAVEEGTSMAGPHVVGTVALMWSANPKLIGDIERTTQILIQTAKPYSGARQGCFQGGIPSDAYGYGVLDAYAAIQMALGQK